MKNWVAELQNDFKWRGRSYWGGLIHGIGIGVGIGFFIALQPGWNNRPLMFWIIIMIGIPSISILGHIILGKSPK